MISSVDLVVMNFFPPTLSLTRLPSMLVEVI